MATNSAKGKTMKRKYSMQSNQMVNAPGLLRWFKSQYWEKSQRPFIIRALKMGWFGDLDEKDRPTDEEFHKVLSGEILVTVTPQRAVEFEVERLQVPAYGPLNVVELQS